MKKVIVIIYITFSQLAYAQREVQYAQYLANPMAINPALAGAREVFHLNAIFRRQILIGIQSLPTSQSFAMDGRLGKNESGNETGFIGLGLQGLLDKTGLTNNTAVSTNVAYHYRLAEDQMLSFGFSGGVNMLPIVDPITRNSINQAKGSIGFGVHLDTDMFWAGLSIPEILSHSYGGLSALGALQSSRPIFIQGGLKLYPVNDVVIKPSVVIAYNSGRPLGFDLNVQGKYQEKFGAALSYRQSTITPFQKTNYFYGLITYALVPNIEIGVSYSSKVAEAYLNDRGIYELMFTFIPNPNK